MKKITLFTIVSFLFSFHVFSEIIRWKGMEMGLPENPKWLESYILEHNEKPLRKKFSMSKDESIVVGLGSAADLESARSISQLDAQKKAADSQKDKKNRLVPVYEYWEEDDEKGFRLYSVYTY